jgi:ADP-heptose:LPS heptosyltransferase
MVDGMRIAVLRANAIGDLVFTLPALDALRRTFPDAEIVLVGAPWMAPFLGGRPSPVDRVEVAPPVPGVSVPAGAAAGSGVRAFVAERRRERFDVALQLHGGGRYSNPFVSSFGARVTAGMRAPGAAVLDRWVRYSLFQHEVLRLLEVVALVGAAPAGVRPTLAVTEADLVAADEALAGRGGSAPLVVLHPGASDARRRWPAAAFARVGETLARRGADVVVTGGPGDRELAAEVVGALPAPAGNLACRLTVGGLVGVLSQAAVVVANDTGPLHLARAVGTPTVGIYWCGNMINAGPVVADRHRTAVSWQVGCPICGRRNTDERCRHVPSFVAEVPVAEVTAHALDLAGL